MRDHTQYYYKREHVGQKRAGIEPIAIASDLLPLLTPILSSRQSRGPVLELRSGRLGNHVGKGADVVGRRSPEAALVMHGVVVRLVFHDRCRRKA